jgi:hypothetical protein
MVWLIPEFLNRLILQKMLEENFFHFHLINLPVINAIWLDDEGSAIFANIQAAGQLTLDPVWGIEIIQLVSVDQRLKAIKHPLRHGAMSTIPVATNIHPPDRKGRG